MEQINLQMLLKHVYNFLLNVKYKLHVGNAEFHIALVLKSDFSMQYDFKPIYILCLIILDGFHYCKQSKDSMCVIFLPNLSRFQDLSNTIEQIGQVDCIYS